LTQELNTDGSLFGLTSQDPSGWSGSAGEARSGEWSASSPLRSIQQYNRI